MSDFGPAAQEGITRTSVWARLSLRRLGDFIRAELDDISKGFVENENYNLELRYATWIDRFTSAGYSPGQTAQVIYTAYRHFCLLAGRAVDGGEDDMHFKLFAQRLRNLSGDQDTVELVVGTAASVVLQPDLCNDQPFAAKLDELSKKPLDPATPDFFAS